MNETVTRTINELEQPSEVHTVWIGEEDRIASFHAVDSYELQSFVCHDVFIKYLRALQKRGSGSSKSTKKPLHRNSAEGLL